MKRNLVKKTKNAGNSVELYNIECTNTTALNNSCSVNPPSNSWVSCTAIPAIKGWFGK